MYTGFGSQGWVWFEGVVEDRDDPLGIGRVRVRVIGLHTPDKTEIPTEHLPWAQVLHPVTSPAMNGIGETPKLMKGAHVSGYFRDGENCQDPVIWGAFGGIPQGVADSSTGFNDPTGEYPKKDYIDEPDTSRLARGENLHKTYVKKRNESAEQSKKIKTATGSEWNIPGSAYNAKYPYNSVRETESGHVIEYDDTPGSERIHTMHRKGTYSEIDKNGTKVTRVVGDNYTILDRNGFVQIYGDSDVTIDGSKNLYVKNALNVRIDGKAFIDCRNDAKLNVYGNLESHVQGDHTHKVNGDMIYRVGGRVIMNSANDMSFNTQGSFNGLAENDFAIDGGFVWLACGKSGNPDNETIEKLGEIENNRPAHFPQLPISSISEDLYNEHDTPDDPPSQSYYEKLESLGLPKPDPDQPAPETKEESQEEAPVKDAEPVSCQAFAGKSNIPGTTQLSANYMLRDVSSNAVVSHYRVRAQVGLTESQIACNLKAICENVAEKVLTKFPDAIVTSGFRHGSGRSQHNRGQALDFQFTNASKSDYYGIAQWMRDNVPFDQLILEYKNTGTQLPWIHVSYNKDGNRTQHFTMFNHRRVSDYGEFKRLV